MKLLLICLICGILSVKSIYSQEEEGFGLGGGGTDTEDAEEKNKAVMKLIQYGYLEVNTSQFNSKVLQGQVPTVDKTKFETSVKSFQKGHGLSESGKLDSETKTKLFGGRCGVADHGKYSGNGKKWGKKSLTYSISTSKTSRTLPMSTVKREVRKAFSQWENVADLKFEEVPFGTKSDFVIEFATNQHDGDAEAAFTKFDGPGGMYGHAFSPEDGRIHFDNDDDFSESGVSNYNMLQVATHQIGHALGLKHSTETDSIMGAYYGGWKGMVDNVLSDSDIKAIVDLYGPKKTTAAPSTPKPTTPRPLVSVKSPTGPLDLCNKKNKITASFMGKDSYMNFVVSSNGSDWLVKVHMKNKKVVGSPAPFNQYFDYTNVGIDAMMWFRRARTYFIFKGEEDIYRYDEYGEFKGLIKRTEKFAPAAAFVDDKMKSYVISTAGDTYEFNPYDFSLKKGSSISSAYSGAPSGITGVAEDYPFPCNRQAIYFYKNNEYFKFNETTKEKIAGPTAITTELFGC